MTKRSLRTGAVLVASCLAVASACGCASEEAGNLSQSDSPLAPYLSDAFSSGVLADNSEAKREKAATMENFIASCMKAQGFEYVPHVSDLSLGILPHDPGIPSDTRDFAERFGYGVFTDPYGIFDPEYDQRVREASADPNDDYVNMLSPLERDAYNIALRGYASQQQDDLADEVAPGGCREDAYVAVNGSSPHGNTEFSALIEGIDTIAVDWLADPRLMRLDEGWSSCMADNGHTDLASPESARQRFNDELSSMMDESQLSVDREGSAVTGTSEPFDFDDPEIHAAAEREIATAVADWNCRDKVRFEDERLRILFEYEQRFVDANKAELETFKAWLEQFGSREDQ